jgi:hypothetical protein
VLRAARETETTQENIQHWLELDEGDPGFQLLVFLQFLNKGSTLIFSSLNLDDHSSQLFQISEGLLYFFFLFD